MISDNFLKKLRSVARAKQSTGKRVQCQFDGWTNDNVGRAMKTKAEGILVVRIPVREQSSYKKSITSITQYINIVTLIRWEDQSL